jgi:predicted O-methyltransferase YrrM
VIISVAATAGWLVLGPASVVLDVALLALLILLVLFESFRRLSRAIGSAYAQLEALMSVLVAIQPGRPLPQTRDWAASPDLLKLIAQAVLNGKPDLVVEASSGVSTLVIAYCLKRIGKGRVVSLEHSPEYAAASRDMIASHGLADTATVIHAPLREAEIAGDRWLWYDLDCLELAQPIDLLVVDGPPAATQHLARYPALPLLRPQLADGSTIILDDGDRNDEREIVRRWQTEFDDITCEYLPLEKGAFVMKKSGAPSGTYSPQYH